MKCEYSYTNKYLTKNGEPWFPIMGEIHYSRVRKEDWKMELLKMKAGGVSVISSYVIWIHHEEVENQYDFTGNKDLRQFIQCVKEAGLEMILRIGPWSHAEVRNGGFPDWLLKKDCDIRTNDSKYLDIVEKFYSKIYEQAEGYLLKDDGPIIGVQIENEYGHCGGLNGEEGEKHMRLLLDMAKKTGFDVPIYTATGWGGAVTGGMIPVMGGYCEAPWDQRLTEIEPSGNYIFTHERNDHNIGSDFGFGTGITFDINKFPYLTAELGGGLQVTHHRRPVATANDIGAMTLTKLGSGVNLLGYYMYHGGTNPFGKLTTLQESRETGSPNDLPVFSYDFRAPIREFGQVSKTFKEIKLFASFTNDFEKEFCKMDAHIPEENPLKPTNFTDLRVSVRDDGESGFVFVNNYQRRYKMAEHKDVQLDVKIGGETVTLDKFDVLDGDYYFFPVNMKLADGSVLKKTLTSPLMKLNNDVCTYVFYDNGKGRKLETEGLTDKCRFIVLDRNEALDAYKIVRDKEYIFISSSPVIDCGGSLIKTINNGVSEFKVYPELEFEIENYEYKDRDGDFYVYKLKEEKKNNTEVSYKLISETEEYNDYEFEISKCSGADDCMITVNYSGDRAELIIDGKVCGDNFYLGKNYDISMKYYDFPEKFILRVYPLYKEQKVFLEKWPEFEKDSVCKVNKATATNIYEMKI